MGETCLVNNVGRQDWDVACNEASDVEVKTNNDERESEEYDVAEVIRKQRSKIFLHPENVYPKKLKVEQPIEERSAIPILGFGS